MILTYLRTIKLAIFHSDICKIESMKSKYNCLISTKADNKPKNNDK